MVWVCCWAVGSGGAVRKHGEDWDPVEGGKVVSRDVDLV